MFKKGFIWWVFKVGTFTGLYSLHNECFIQPSLLGLTGNGVILWLIFFCSFFLVFAVAQRGILFFNSVGPLDKNIFFSWILLPIPNTSVDNNLAPRKKDHLKHGSLMFWSDVRLLIVLFFWQSIDTSTSGYFKRKTQDQSYKMFKFQITEVRWIWFDSRTEVAFSN